MEPLDRKYRSPQGHRFRASIYFPTVCRDCGFEVQDHDDALIQDLFGDSPEGWTCDFCRSPDPAVEIPCGTFRVPDMAMTVIGPLIACGECMKLVTAGDGRRP